MSDEPGDRWVTLFARNDDEDRELARLVLAWCRSNGVSCTYRDADQQARDEYNITVFPTLRHFDQGSGEPRTELVGHGEVRAWLSEQESR